MIEIVLIFRYNDGVRILFLAKLLEKGMSKAEI